jgi:hypothetical protein
MKKKILIIVAFVIMSIALVFIMEIIVFNISFRKPVKIELKEQTGDKR